MKKEILNFIINEILKRDEEIKRLEIKDRIAYIGFLIQEISGIPALLLPVSDAKAILKAIKTRIKIDNDVFS